MKTIRKIAAVLLCAALMLALAACGSFETNMVRAASKMEKLESYHMDMNLDMNLALSMMGQSMDMDMLLRMASDYRMDPLQVRSAMTAEVMGESTEILTYIFASEQEGRYDVYASSDGGASWDKSTLDTEELKQEFSFSGDSLIGSAEFLRDSAKSFAEVGKEEVNGSQATRFDGVIEGEAIGDALEASGIFESLGEAFPIDMSESLEEFSGSIPVSLWIDDKSGMLVRYDMDLTEVFASVWDTMLTEILNESGAGIGDLAELGMSFDLKGLTVSAVLSQFNEVGEIVLPEAAKAA